MFCEIWFIKINYNSTDCYNKNFQVHIILRNTMHKLNNKETEKKKKKIIKNWIILENCIQLKENL